MVISRFFYLFYAYSTKFFLIGSQFFFFFFYKKYGFTYLLVVTKSSNPGFLADEGEAEKNAAEFID